MLDNRNSAGYIPNTITALEEVEAGVYLLKVDDYDTAAFDASFQSMGIELTSATQEITVTLAEEKLTKIGSKIVFIGDVADDTVTITVESVVSFDDTANSVGV